MHERHLLPVPDGLAWPEAGGFPEVFTTAHDALFTQCGLADGRAGVRARRRRRRRARRRAARPSPPAATVVATVRNAGRCATRSRRSAPTVVAPDGLRRPRPVRRRPRARRRARTSPTTSTSLATGGRIAVIGVGAGATAELNLLDLMGKRGRIHGSTLRARQPRGQGRRGPGRRAPRAARSLAAGRVQVPVEATFPMAEAAAAYERFAAGGKLGKIVLTGGVRRVVRPVVDESEVRHTSTST